jgi:hypothetical protein
MIDAVSISEPDSLTILISDDVCENIFPHYVEKLYCVTQKEI